MTRMRRTTDWLRDHVLNEADKTGGNSELCGVVPYDEMLDNAIGALDSVGLDRILSLCGHRFMMGYLRYERFLGIDQDVGYARRASLAIARYARTKNQEDLIDAINYILRELQHPSFEGVHYKATDHEEKANAQPG